MRKEKSDSIAIGMCIGVAFGLIFDNLALGITVGAAIGATGTFDSKKKDHKNDESKQ